MAVDRRHRHERDVLIQVYIGNIITQHANGGKFCVKNQHFSGSQNLSTQKQSNVV